MRVRIQIDPPMTNPGITWSGTTFYVSRDKDFNVLELTSVKTVSNGDNIREIILQIDPDVNRIYVRNSIHLSDGTISIPSSPIVIDNDGKSRHTYDALLVTPKPMKGQYFEFDRDITITCDGMRHLKRDPNQIKTTWSVYDTDSIPIYVYSNPGIMNSMVFNTSIYRNMKNNFLTVGVVQTDAHNDTNIGEVILNEEDNKYDIRLIGDLNTVGPRVLYVESNMLIMSGFKYRLLLDGVIIDEGLDHRGHIVIPASINILSNKTYVIHMVIDTTLDSNLIRNIPINSKEITMADIRESIVADMTKITPNDLVYTQHSESSYNGVALHNDTVPSIGINDRAIWFSDRHFDGTPIPSYRKKIYNQIGLTYNIDNNHKSMFTISSSNRLITCYRDIDGRVIVRYDQIFVHTNDSIKISENTSTAISDTFDYVPNIAVAHPNYILTAVINNGNVYLERISISPAYTPDSNDIFKDTGISDIVSDVKIHGTNTPFLLITGKRNDGKIAVHSILNNGSSVINSTVLDVDHGADVVFTPVENTQIKDNIDISGVFTIFNSTEVKMIQYPISNLSLNEVVTVSSNGQIVSNKKIYIMEI